MSVKKYLTLNDLTYFLNKIKAYQWWHSKDKGNK